METNVERINIKKPEISINRLSASTIQQTPAVFGEPDVLKTIQLLPGVTSAGEGSSGFNVRGGAADQKLNFYCKFSEDEIILKDFKAYIESHDFIFSISASYPQKIEFYVKKLTDSCEMTTPR